MFLLKLRVKPFGGVPVLLGFYTIFQRLRQYFPGFQPAVIVDFTDGLKQFKSNVALLYRFGAAARQTGDAHIKIANLRIGCGFVVCV